MMKKTCILLLLVSALCLPQAARAFCGFYVARAETKIFNHASKVVLVRDEYRTVITMANDFEGEPSEFAIVIPVPTFIEKGQIHVANSALIDHLDAYSSPRLVEYFDSDPCQVVEYESRMAAASKSSAGAEDEGRANQLGVKIEAKYTVGEYDILILSAEQSSGLETWLRESGYKIPPGAAEVLQSYLKQNMKFFVAKVNLKEHQKLGFSFLRPLQVAYESPKFMLPIRLGMVNADGPQELFIFALTRKGRIETTNYRTVRLPEGMDIPLFVKDEFTDFYRSMFSKQVEEENMKAVFLEYAWDMSWCDPCASEPLSPQELRELGAFWVPESPGAPRLFTNSWGNASQKVFLTRLHLRYDSPHFPEDLVFQETGDTSNFQARYVLRHSWTGTGDCPAAQTYRSELPKRQEKELEQVVKLTGWKEEAVRKKMKFEGPAGTGSGDPEKDEKNKWWKEMWK